MSKTESLNNPHGDDRIILFDAVCKLCCGWTRFILRFDTQHHFKLCSVQSPAGQKLLKQCGLPTDTFETMVLIHKDGFETKSDALLSILAKMPMPWPLFLILKVLPKRIRNVLYDQIAQNRYKLFGRYNQCMIPRKEDQNRFLE
ncbi:MAG: DUF393 domain-containing protein [Pseudomonadales bacterium]|nr:DUF393 domain-containing protein [Pseudomonadales bacterium]